MVTYFAISVLMSLVVEVVRMFKVVTAKVIISLFALIGVLSVGILLHELSHERDFRYVSNSGKICLIEYKGLGGFYEFNVNAYNSESIEDIRKYTEIKAYAINAILLYILIQCLIIVWRWDKLNVNY